MEPESNTIIFALDGVSCERCRSYGVDLLARGYSMSRARELYEVGNIGRIEMGHQMYHTNNGRIALCIADKR